MKYVIGFDFNMSTLSATVADVQGHIIGGANSNFETYEKDGKRYANPDVWVDESFRLIREVLTQYSVDPADVVSIGTCGHPVYLALLGEDGRPCADSFYWLAGLSLHESGDELVRLVGRDKLIRIAAKTPEVLGLGPHPNGPLALGPMLLWLREHEPETFAKCKKVLYGKDYLNYVLTGRAVMDVSDASFTLLLDVKKRDWSEEILSDLALDRSLLPDAVECAEVIGRVTAEGAARSGLKEGTLVVGGLTNKAAIAITGKATKNGVTVPTVKSCNVVAASEKYVCDPTGQAHTYCSAVPGEYFVMCDGANVGNDMVWFLETYHSDIFENMRGKRGAPLAKTEAYIKDVPAGANGVVYLPYAGGAGAPHPDKNAKGVFYGIGKDTTDADLTRAVMEATCYELRSVYEYLESLGIRCDENYYHMWGTAPYHSQMLADCTGKPALLARGGGPVHGAAIVALAGSGECRDIYEAVDRFVREIDVTQPDAAAHEGFQQGYATYKKLYKALSTLFRDE